MSVFKNLKGTIVGVQHDISASFKNLRIGKPVDGAPPSASDVLDKSGVNLNAGADLLNKFQTQWADLHDESEKNAQRAKDVDREVSEIFLYLERQNDAASQFLAELSSLPQLTKQVEDIITKLGQISGEFAELNHKLLELEDAVEAHELQANKDRNTHQLRLYKQKKDVELEIVKVKLARTHAEKSQEHEARLQETLMVRQKAFEEAYNEEIQNYKMYGQTHFKRSPTEDKHVELADITIDEDPNALDDFLNSEDVAVVTEPTLPPPEPNSPATLPAAGGDGDGDGDKVVDPTAAAAVQSDFCEIDVEEPATAIEVMQDEDYVDKKEEALAKTREEDGNLSMNQTDGGGNVKTDEAETVAAAAAAASEQSSSVNEPANSDSRNDASEEEQVAASLSDPLPGDTSTSAAGDGKET